MTIVLIWLQRQKIFKWGFTYDSNRLKYVFNTFFNTSITVYHCWVIIMIFFCAVLFLRMSMYLIQNCFIIIYNLYYWITFYIQNIVLKLNSICDTWKYGSILYFFQWVQNYNKKQTLLSSSMIPFHSFFCSLTNSKSILRRGVQGWGGVLQK